MSIPISTAQDMLTEAYQVASSSVLRILEAAKNNKSFPQYLAVEGPIGVGKTTLAKRLANLMDYPLLLEPVTENPFLDRFYAEGPNQALPTQLFFLLQRAKQVQDMPGNDLLDRALVTDFMIEKDDLFATLTLDPAELDLYRQIQSSLKLVPPRPDLVIYLQAPARVLKQRVFRRGIDFEQSIHIDYLDALADSYAEFFHYYDDAPVLIVNAAEIDFVNNEDHFIALLEQILQMEGTRQFFNPNPTLL
ncbi:MAG: deoxynucleoside kinase [Pseudomonadota bacterium]|nr:deoxynucleoside kinase [Pseudomonadota bacterium]